MRILFIAPLRYIAVLPFVCETIYELSNGGHQIDIIVSSCCKPPLEVVSENMNVMAFHDNPNSPFRVFYFDLFRKTFS